jgi:hypothetical protein
MCQARPIIETMATKEELARIRSVLNEIDGGIIGAR